jgi:hypothetical protein
MRDVRHDRCTAAGRARQRITRKFEMLKTALFALTTGSLISTAAAGDLTKKTKSPGIDIGIVKQLYGETVAKEYADVKGPVIDTVDPGPRCNDIKASYSMNMPLYEQSVAGIPFTAGVAGELKLESTSTKLSVTGSLGPSIAAFGEVYTPLDLNLSASTNSVGLNSVDVSITAFGQTLYTDNLANSTQALALSETFNWSLPRVFTQEISDTINIGNITSRVRNAVAKWKVKATAQAHVGGFVMFNVNSTGGVQARAFVSNDAYAALVANASLSGQFDPPDFQSDWHNFTLKKDFTATLDIIRSTFGGRGRLVPHNGNWLADAGASFSLTDTMGAYIGHTFSISIPIVDDPSYTLKIFDLDPTSWSDTWKYSCTFAKKF